MNLDLLKQLTDSYNPSVHTPALRAEIEKAIASNLGIETGEDRHLSRVRIWSGYLIFFFTLVTGVMALAASAKLIALDNLPFAGCWSVFVGGLAEMSFASLKRK